MLLNDLETPIQTNDKIGIKIAKQRIRVAQLKESLQHERQRLASTKAILTQELISGYENGVKGLGPNEAAQKAAIQNYLDTSTTYSTNQLAVAAAEGQLGLNEAYLQALIDLREQDRHDTLEAARNRRLETDDRVADLLLRFFDLASETGER
jgi:hypothetical protein